MNITKLTPKPCFKSKAPLQQKSKHNVWHIQEGERHEETCNLRSLPACINTHSFTFVIDMNLKSAE